MAITLNNYYNRFDPSDNYEAHLFLPDSVLQSAELNEIQSAFDYRVSKIADVLFADGAIISGCDIQVDGVTGATELRSGVLYLMGMMRGIAPENLVVSVSGTVYVGAWLADVVVTATQDASLLDPAVSMLNYHEPGAARLQREPTWGLSTDEMPEDARFYPVYTIIDGVVVPREPPPQIEAIALAIARYDVQSTGGHYISNGMRVTWLPDTNSGKQQFSIDTGTARINGRELTALHALRVTHDTSPNLAHVALEIHTAASSPDRVNLYHTPLAAVTQVLATLEDSTTVTKGVANGSDEIRKNGQLVTGITALVSVVQGVTTYTPTMDYVLTADKVDWSPGGAEPSPGSTYTVTYRYIAEVAPTSIDDDGFSVTGAVSGTQILVEYDWKMPRIDRICLGSNGVPVVLVGVPHPSSPAAPRTPVGVLGLANAYQTWRSTTRVVRNNGVRMVPMESLENLADRVIDLYSLVADERLRNNANALVPASKRGLFVDGFFDNDMRDAGLAQTAVIQTALQELTLGVTQHIETINLAGPQSLVATGNRYAVNQLMATGCQLINEYMVFDPLPGAAELTPNSDYWTEFNTTWLSPVVERIVMPRPGDPRQPANWWRPVDSTEIVVMQTIREELAPLLRPIEIEFTLRFFGSGELLNTVLFDGESVSFSA